MGHSAFAGFAVASEDTRRGRFPEGGVTAEGGWEGEKNET